MYVAGYICAHVKVPVLHRFEIIATTHRVDITLYNKSLQFKYNNSSNVNIKY